MKINELYIEQTNQFCEANCKISAEDILAKAKQRQAEIVLSKTSDEKDKIQITATSDQNKTTAKKNEKVITMPSGKKTMFRLSHVVAACLATFVLTGTTILAFSGKIGNFLGDTGATVIAFDERKMEFFFRDVLGDETTAELVGKGYLYEINQTQEDENFRIDVVAASGDIENAKLAVDVYVKDDELAAANDRIYLVCYMTKPGEEVVKDPNGCSVSGGYGIKDESVDNLYHVLIDISSNHSEIEYHFTTVITTFASDEDQELYLYDWLPCYMESHPFWRFHSTDILFDITIPAEAYSILPSRQYKEVVYHGTKYEYHLDSVEYGYYDMKLNFEFDFESDFVADSEDAMRTYGRYMSTELHSMLQDAVLIIDDKEYYYDGKFVPDGYCTFSDKEGASDHCEITVYFPATDYFDADTILLRIGDETYDLKESK